MDRAIAEVKRVVPPQVLYLSLLVISHIALASITTQFIAPYVPASTAAILSVGYSPWMLPFMALRVVEPLAVWFGGLDGEFASSRDWNGWNEANGRSV